MVLQGIAFIRGKEALLMELLGETFHCYESVLKVRSGVGLLNVGLANGQGYGRQN